jgi:hypothetical protein
VLDTIFDSTSGEFRSNMMLVAGVGILIWVLLRRSHKSRVKRAHEDRAIAKQQRQLQSHRDSGAPTVDAPPEILRWQSSMFDLQRELKAELESKISVLQAVVRIADERIAILDRLTRTASVAGDTTTGAGDITAQLAAITAQLQRGRSLQQIAETANLSPADRELVASLLTGQASTH